MLKIQSLTDIQALRESDFVECKLAQGRDGLGELPKNIWESYCAFANAEGGDILLGLHELADQSFELAGINNTRKVIDDLWVGLNNPNVVSVNLISQNGVQVFEIAGKQLIQIHVPKAATKDRPVYLAGNPMGGCFHRVGSSDKSLSVEDVKEILDEQA